MASKECAALSGRARVVQTAHAKHNCMCMRDIRKGTVRNAISTFLFTMSADTFPGAFFPPE